VLTHSTADAVLRVDGQLVGRAHGGKRAFYVELVRALLAELGVAAPIETVPLARGLKWLAAEPQVALFNLSRTPAREAQFRWVGPISYERDYLYQRGDDALELRQLDDARQGGVCVVNQNVHDQLLSGMKFTDLARVRSVEQCLRMLMAGRVRYLGAAESGMDRRLQQLGIAAGAVRRSAVMLMESPGYIALSAQTPEHEVERWNAALHKLQREGVVERLQGLYGR
jgi:polar amino acid transport system substrate-binding protein